MDKSKDISCVCKTGTSRRFSPSKSYVKMTLKGALNFFIRLAEENFVIHVRVRVFCLLLYILEHSKCVFIYNRLIINKNMVSIKYT